MSDEIVGAKTVQLARGFGQRMLVNAYGGFWLGPISWLIALLGFGLLSDASRRQWGAVFILLACVLAAIGYGATPFPSAFPTLDALKRATTKSRRNILSLAGIALSLLLCYGANASFVSNPKLTFGLAGWLWLISMALLLLSCLIWRSGSITTEQTPPSYAWPIWEIAVLVGLVLGATFLRVWDLNNFPFVILGDERTTGQVARASYFGPPDPSLFGVLWNSVSLPGLWFWLVARSLEIGGNTLWALRLPAAIFGAATVIPFYGFVRLAWGRNTAIVGTAIMAFSAVDVNYSRITLNNIVTPFFWSVCFFFLLRGMRYRRPVDWAAAGLAGGLSEYGYYGTRLLPFILLAFFLYLLVANRRQARFYIAHFLLVPAGYLVAFGPLLARYTTNPALYLDRGGTLSWDHIPTNWADLQRMWATLWPLMADNLLGINTESSQDVMYHAPLLLGAEAALLALGIAVLIAHWRHPPSFLMVLTIVSVVFAGGTLVNYSAVPFLGHWTPAFPAIYAAIAVPVGAWLQQGKMPLPERVGKLAPLVIGLGLVILGYLNISFYFRDYYADPARLKDATYRQAMSDLELQSAEAHYQAALGSEYMVRILGKTEYLNNTNLIYLVRRQDYAAIQNPDDELPVSRTAGKGLAFIFMPGGEQYREQMEVVYPGGKDVEVRSRDGRHLFYAYILAPGP